MAHEDKLCRPRRRDTVPGPSLRDRSASPHRPLRLTKPRPRWLRSDHDSPTSPKEPTYFPTCWDEPKCGRIIFANQLAAANISVADISVIDHPVVQGLFGTRLRKRKIKKHKPMAVVSTQEHGHVNRYDLLAEAIKIWDLSGAGRMASRLDVRASVDTAVLAFSSDFPWVGEGKFVDDCGRLREGKFTDTLRWSLFAYALIHVYDSPVRLKKIKFNEHNFAQATPNGEQPRKFHFGVLAREDIPANVYIPELLGLMSSDTTTEDSGVSSIMPHPDQTGPREPRILVGPIRFINHVCDRDGGLIKPNIRLYAIEGTAAFVARTIQPIPEGDELLLDYGRDYWLDRPGGCPCLVCKHLGQKTDKVPDSLVPAVLPSVDIRLPG